MIESHEFYPLGSVVTIQGSPKTLMIVSRALAYKSDEGKTEYYDYGLVLYPEGMLRDTMIYTNHELIDQVLFRGFENEENAKVVADLQELLPKLTIPKADPAPNNEW
ncbi:DUF4176 domain-containing protein [Enorma phocaeensis]|uniref:DUF4176 domain-containing protein n=1 Tax=Enorma phocaeensis TaxID=1871019 RepID=UPI0015E0AF28|nr:DUF4176 domain-containing protein [Enorma phocaeensis]